MQYLATGSNTITTTVDPYTSIAKPDFIFVFVNDNTGKKVACTSTETQLDGNRSSFPIIVGVNDPLNNSVLFDDYGFYHYYIYEDADALTYDYANIDNVDLRTLTGLLDEGKAYWQPPTVTNNYYKDIRTSIKTYGQ